MEENKKPEARARANKSDKMKDRMKRATLESKLQNMQRLVDSLTGTNNVLRSYVNVKIVEPDGRKQVFAKQIAALTVEAIHPEQVSWISGYLDTWENVSFDDKRRVVDLMITTLENKAVLF